MNNDFLRAAASYYGMNPDTTATDWQNDGGAMLFTFSIHATEDDMAGILQRMKAMREKEAQRQIADPAMQEEIVENETIRAEYNDLSPADKSKYGSFARFRAGKVYDEYIAAGSAPLNRKVEHINVPEDSEPVSMDAVWIDEVDATDAQRQFAVDMCRKRGLLVQWAMLTEEQKAQAKEKKL